MIPRRVGRFFRFADTLEPGPAAGKYVNPAILVKVEESSSSAVGLNNIGKVVISDRVNKIESDLLTYLLIEIISCGSNGNLRIYFQVLRRGLFP